MCKGYACCLAAVLAAVMLVSVQGGAQSAQAPAQQSTPAQPRQQTFVVVYERGSAWDESNPAMAQTGIGDHIQFIRANIDRLVGAGPFLEALAPGGADRVVGMVIVQAATPEEASALIAKDPAITSNLMKFKVRNWQVEHVKGF